MSKQVHWQLPFVSLKGIQYRIDIYADGTPTGGVKQLVGWATPFVTDEDNSEDFFAPVRGQTGSINIVDTDGTLMAELMPVDNVDRPVRLIRVSDGAILWQGFLSCEAYNQPYTSRPTEITIPVNSVLAAMQSVQLPLDQADFVTVAQAIGRMMVLMDGKECYILEYYLPIDSINVVSKYIDTTVLFELKQQDNENSTTYTPVGISLYDAFSRICAYMGWTLRESGNRLYFIDAANTSGYRRYYRRGVILPDGTVVVSYVVEPTKSYPVTTSSVATFEYRGTGHQIEQRQGAKSVEVVANVSEYNLDMQLPECPVGALIENFGTIVTHVDSQGRWRDNKKVRILANSNPSFNNKCEFYYHFADFVAKTTSSGNFNDAYHDSVAYPEGIGGTWTCIENHRTLGAFMARLGVGETTDTQINVETTDGLYVSGNANISTMLSQYKPNLPLFKLYNILYFSAADGYIVINMNALIFASGDSVLLVDESSSTILNTIFISLCIGDKYWNGTSWQDGEATFKVYIDKGKIEGNYDPSMDIEETEGYLIPISARMVGEVKLTIYSLIAGSYIDETGTMQDYATDLFITTLSVGYTYNHDELDTDRPANHYYRLLGLNFSEEVSVSTDLASDLNNRPSPAILMNSETEPMTTLHYADGTDERPERHLLDRLATYYGAARTRITLETDRPSEAHLPLTRLTGYDGKIYIPLSESMDWRADTSTIRCFECPE